MRESLNPKHLIIKDCGATVVFDVVAAELRINRIHPGDDFRALARIFYRADKIQKALVKPTHFIVQTSIAAADEFGSKHNIAVLEVEKPLERVSSIRPTARGLRRIVRLWPRVFKGLTKRSAYYRVLAEANALADTLNQEKR